ncbi:hypothetical protein TSO5_02125 [Azospirillum sp. TSO5]|nr:hypothetical protein TSO5_02125 [Azospirillum sp. TSO5]
MMRMAAAGREEAVEVGLWVMPEMSSLLATVVSLGASSIMGRRFQKPAEDGCRPGGMVHPERAGHIDTRQFRAEFPGEAVLRCANV